MLVESERHTKGRAVLMGDVSEPATEHHSDGPCLLSEKLKMTESLLKFIRSPDGLIVMQTFPGLIYGEVINNISISLPLKTCSETKAFLPLRWQRLFNDNDAVCYSYHPS